MESNIKKRQTFLIAFVSFISGVFVTASFYHIVYFSSLSPFFQFGKLMLKHPALNSDSTDKEDENQSQDPFAEMRKMQEEMMGSMKSIQVFGGLGIESTENENEYLFTIPLNGQNIEDLNVETQNEQLTITGKFVSKDDHLNMSSQIHQSFPLPQDADGEKIDIKKLENKIQIHLPKKRI